jgi:hypothetical protein
MKNVHSCPEAPGRAPKAGGPDNLIVWVAKQQDGQQGNLIGMPTDFLCSNNRAERYSHSSGYLQSWREQAGDRIRILRKANRLG